MKKVLSFVLVLMMILCITACGSKEEKVVGNWTCELDITDYFLDSFANFVDEPLEINEKLIVTLKLDLNKDGSYSLDVSEEETRLQFNNFLEPLGESLADLMYRIGEESGVSKADMDSAMVAQYGVDVNGYVDQILNNLDINDLFEDSTGLSGFYKVDGNKILFAKDKEDLDDKDFTAKDFSEYSLNGNTLVLKSIAEGGKFEEFFGDGKISAPFTFKK